MTFFKTTYSNGLVLYSKEPVGVPTEMRLLKQFYIGVYLKRSREYLETLADGTVYEHIPSLKTNSKGKHLVKHWSETLNNQ